MSILLTSEQVLQQVEHLNTIFGKTQKKEKSKSCIWKKRSIFFDLPYWSDLDLRHCIDFMHMEKNLCDNVIGTLLNIQGKTKNGLNTHHYLAEMGIRSQLHPRFDGKKIILAFSLSYFVQKGDDKFLSMFAPGQSPTRILDVIVPSKGIG